MVDVHSVLLDARQRVDRELPGPYQIDTRRRRVECYQRITQLEPSERLVRRHHVYLPVDLPG